MEQKDFFLISSRCFHFKCKVTNFNKPSESIAPVCWKKYYFFFSQKDKKERVLNYVRFLFIYHRTPAGMIFESLLKLNDFKKKVSFWINENEIIRIFGDKTNF